MDTKYKIIIVVFILIALLYAGHFIIDYMNSNKKKEAFTLFDDDVEHYEEPKPSKRNIGEENRKSKNESTSEESKYDLRVLILDDIETLKITDKDQKGKLMEIMFNENTLKKVSTLSDKQRLKFIEEKYNSLGVSTALGESTLSEADITNEDSQLNKSVKNVVSRFKGFEDDSTSSEDLPKVPTPSSSKNVSNSELSQELVHRTADTMTKLQTVQNNLETVQKSLKDMQKYVASIDPSSKIDLASKSGFQMPKIPELPGAVIEGFENIRGFAPAF